MLKTTADSNCTVFQKNSNALYIFKNSNSSLGLSTNFGTKNRYLIRNSTW